MKIAHGTLVMVMDGRKMALLRNEGDAQKPSLSAVLEKEVDNPKASLQGTDRPGRSFASANPRRSALGETDWHEEAKERFAVEALRELEQELARQPSSVILLAAPSTLGEFRKHCDNRMKDHIAAEIDKDVVNHLPEDIVKVIDAHEP